MKKTSNSNLKRLVLASFIYIACTIQAQGQTQEPFVTTWRVGASDLSITIPTKDGLTYDYTVDWGDGVSDTTTYTGDATHTYQAAGTYTVAISGDFPAIQFANLFPEAGDNSLKIKTIKSWGAQRWLTLAYAFKGCQNLTTIEDGAGIPDLTMVTDMDGTFYGATNFNGDLSSWDVSNVTDMRWTFSGASSFNGNLSSWNVSNVTAMPEMFGSATSFNQDLSSWNVSNLKGMTGMFVQATSFNQDLSNWNVSNVTDMRVTFEGATSFTSDLSTWDVSNVTNMGWTFYGATSFNQDISSWDVSNVTTMENMFNSATSFSSKNYDALLTGWSGLPSLQDDVDFTAPPTTYCNGKTGRGILTGTYNWDITGDSGEDCSATSVDD